MSSLKCHRKQRGALFIELLRRFCAVRNAPINLSRVSGGARRCIRYGGDPEVAVVVVVVDFGVAFFGRVLSGVHRLRDSDRGGHCFGGTVRLSGRTAGKEEHG